MINLINNLVNQRYIVQRKISSGSFGVVFLAQDKLSKDDVAIKVEKEDNADLLSLEKEYEFLKILHSVHTIPKVHWYGHEHNLNILVMELLGNDLAYYMKKMKKFSLIQVLEIAVQAVKLLQATHQKGILHRDLKPENLVLGREKKAGQLYLIDFGISKLFLANKIHMYIQTVFIYCIARPYRQHKAFIGTTRYASCAAHKGEEIGRKDDLESLFYILIYFLRGQLPWQSLQVQDKDRTRIVGEMKQNMDLGELCDGLNQRFITILQYIKSLNFYDEPDYWFIIKQFKQMAEDEKYELDGQIEWCEKKLQQKRTSIENHTPLVNQRYNYHLLWSLTEQGQQQNKLFPPEMQKQRSSISSKSCQKKGELNRLMSSSSQNSQQGTFSSMKIKYVPSVDLSQEKQRIKVSNSLPVVQEEKKMKESSCLISDMDHVDEENLDDIPLWNRYYKLKSEESRMWFERVRKTPNTK